MAQSRSPKNEDAVKAILRHWQEAVPDDRLAHLVKDTWRGLTRAFQTRLSEHSVSFGHWVFLRILWETDGLTQSQLSQEAGLMMPTTFSALRTMERLGYICREQRPDSRRKVYIFLTAKGRALKDELVPLAEQVNAIAVRDVSPADVAATRRTLLAMIENLAQDEIDLLKKKRKVPSTRDLVHLGPDDPERKPSKERRRGKAPVTKRAAGSAKEQDRSGRTVSRSSATATPRKLSAPKRKRQSMTQPARARQSARSTS
jgi:MarR family transcriptional regulator, organic hydroperoxide resistance regulator